MSSRRFAWDHNAWYHPLLLRRLPPRPARVLDVGCGAGALAAILATRAAHVDALDCSPEMIALARARTPANVRCIEADVMTVDLPPGHYDAIVSASALHHLELATTLPRLARWLRPGGVLVAVALPRSDLPRELPVEAGAAVLQRVVGVGLEIARRTVADRDLLRQGPDHARMPVREAELTVREVRARAGAALPGARVRRLLFWRYLLEWRSPTVPWPGPVSRRPARCAPTRPSSRTTSRSTR